MKIDLEVKNQIDKHFSNITNIFKTDLWKSHYYFDQKFTYDNFLLSSFIIYFLFNYYKQFYSSDSIDEEIKEKCISFIFDDKNFLSILFNDDILDEKSKNDKKTAIKQGINILKVSEIICINDKKIQIINEYLLDLLVKSDENVFIYFMCKYFEKTFIDLNLFDLVKSSVLVYFGISKNKFNKSPSRKELDNAFAKACAQKFGEKEKSKKNITRIFHKPLSYIDILLHNNSNWYNLEKLSYICHGVVALKIKEIKIIIEKSVSQFICSDSSNDNGLKSHSDVIKKIDEFIEWVDSNLNIGETEKHALIKTRIGQQFFRQSLFKIYPKCILSDIDVPEILNASHIVPWNECDNNDRLNPCNGLLFIASIDRLFDSNLISFDDYGHIYYSEKLKNKYPNYINLLRQIGVKSEYLCPENNKSIFLNIDKKYHDKLRKYLTIHFTKTKNNV